MLMEDLKDELRLAYHEMDQLVSLQRAGLLTMSDFLRMSHEISKTNADRLEEARGDDASAKSSEQSEMMVDESGNLLEATSALDDTGSGSEVDAAEKELSVFGSFSDEVGEDLSRDEEVRDELAPLEFPMGTPVIVKRGGKWSGVVTSYGHDANNFLTFGKYQVKYETKTRKGRGFQISSVSAWVAESDLAQRVVSPWKEQQAPDAGEEGSAPTRKTQKTGASNTADRPHMRQPDMEDDGHPAMAAHERGRKMRQNEKPSQSLLGERKTKESTVPIAQRLREFPNQSLMEDVAHKLFCQCCKRTIRNDKGTIKTHVSGSTHAKLYKLWLSKHETDANVKEFLFEYFQKHPAETMASLPSDVLLFRFNVMETILAACLPPQTLDILSGLLKESVPDASNMKQFVPKVEAFEFDRVRNEIRGQKVTVIFDGTTRLGEAIVVLLRWCPADFSGIQMRLVTFATAKTFRKTT